MDRKFCKMQKNMIGLKTTNYIVSLPDVISFLDIQHISKIENYSDHFVITFNKEL